jgi:hypothetical protein
MIKYNFFNVDPTCSFYQKEFSLIGNIVCDCLKTTTIPTEYVRSLTRVRWPLTATCCTELSTCLRIQSA